MEIQELKAFVELTKFKNFTRAAEKLHISQSTVTMRIKSLELSLGKKLLIRDNRYVELTTAGKRFLLYAQRILELVQESERIVAADEEFEDQLVLGSLNSLWEYMLFPALDQFAERYPTIALRTIIGHSDEIINKIMDGIIDVGIVYIPPKGLDMEVVPLFSNTLKLVAHQSFDIGEQPISIQELSTYPYVHMDWGDPFSSWYRSETGKGKVHSLQVDHAAYLLKFIQSGKYYGFLLNSVCDPLIEKGELKQIELKLDKPVPKRTTYLIYPKRKEQQLGVSTWIDYILSIDLGAS
ncbi:LysR family transcriptional regulator [Bacillus horti]|uniref:DNA-binding transcriptional LysR family regulator n=1 Tax=Caldalkalibacillus horti TaxID=77523 RepID=A0ABT9W2P7_9BACI|nr:LysR family transcriptional regulator [Bacillus horti]MDQ0167530.1 DNA-binding transcriptional LysR family regulator [Bacillus horti]